MTRLTGEIQINAPKEKVWDILADLGKVHIWNPVIANAYYTSEATDGVGAARHCDFPDGGYVKERTTEWKPGEAYTLEIYEGTVPFERAAGSFAVKDAERGAIVSFTFEYELKSDAPVDPQEVERQNREELIPTVLAGLKHYAETGAQSITPRWGGRHSL